MKAVMPPMPSDESTAASDPVPRGAWRSQDPLPPPPPPHRDRGEPDAGDNERETMPSPRPPAREPDTLVQRTDTDFSKHPTRPAPRLANARYVDIPRAPRVPTVAASAGTAPPRPRPWQTPPRG